MTIPIGMDQYPVAVAFHLCKLDEIVYVVLESYVNFLLMHEDASESILAEWFKPSDGLVPDECMREILNEKTNEVLLCLNEVGSLVLGKVSLPDSFS